MQQFVYRAKDATGQLISAEIEAASAGEAAKLLISKQLFPISVDPKQTGVLSKDFLDRFQRITTKDKVLFTRQLATLVKAGLPLARALHILQQQTTNPNMLKLVRSITNSVEGGDTLSKSLARYPKQFSNIYLSMVEAGEVSGTLDDTLLRLAAQEEKSAAIIAKIRGAFTYPVVVLAVLVGVTVLMLVLVLPQVAQIYVSLNAQLPFFTQVLLSISHAMQKFWYLFVLLLVGLVYMGRLWVLSPKGRATVDNLKLKTPPFNVLFQKLYMARFARTLGSLIQTGVPVLQALNIVARSINNVHIESAIDEVASRVKTGGAMSQAVSDNPTFLPLVGQMMSVGEQTGTIADSLGKVASYYEDDVDQAISTIQTLIEPATMVILGLMVAFLIGAVLVPIYNLVSQIH